MPPVILWFRQDLRVSDNPALQAALEAGQPILPLFMGEETPSCRPWGGASRWWLHQSLTALQKKVPALCLRRGDPAVLLPALIQETGATRVFWNRRYDPAGRQTDAFLEERLKEDGIEVLTFNGRFLYEPGTILNQSKEPFQVFTPYWKRCLREPAPAFPCRAPSAIPTFPFPSESLADWKLLPTHPNWAAQFSEIWTPGEEGAQARLAAFVDTALDQYRDQRNAPAQAGTSRLSPHLHWGEISPRQVWHAVHIKRMANPALATHAEAYLAEIGWREFCATLLWYHPRLAQIPLRLDFATFPWRQAPQDLEAWQQGRTGYPIVDAGMRQLWRTGWMHNRVRMIVASFLVKDLLISWQAGEEWFWDTLVDADAANNAANWQWVAGCGADAAPYFRVFNPVLQGEKFDPSGAYVRQWVPELSALPDRYIHKPWLAPLSVLHSSRVRLGVTYPFPLVDHQAARARALEIYQNRKSPLYQASLL